jgi:hypothetical protein
MGVKNANVVVVVFVVFVVVVVAVWLCARAYRITPQLSMLVRPAERSFFLNAFQKRSVSSPAPVTMTWPSGLMARYSTRYVCPVKDTTCCMLGYFHTMIWFWL